MTNQKSVKAGSTRRKRMTAKRKQEAIKRVDRGEPIELVARSFDVSAADVGRWMKKADYAVLGALKDGEEDGKDLQIKELQSKVGELIMLLELRDEKIERLEAGRPLVRFEVRAMSFVVWAFREKALRRGAGVQGLADEQHHRVSSFEGGIADIG